MYARFFLRHRFTKFILKNFSHTFYSDLTILPPPPSLTLIKTPYFIWNSLVGGRKCQPLFVYVCICLNLHAYLSSYVNCLLYHVKRLNMIILYWVGAINSDAYNCIFVYLFVFLVLVLVLVGIYPTFIPQASMCLNHISVNTTENELTDYCIWAVGLIRDQILQIIF